MFVRITVISNYVQGGDVVRAMLLSSEVVTSPNDTHVMAFTISNYKLVL